MSDSDAHVIATRAAYERYAEAYAHHRSDRSAIRPHVERFVSLLPGGASVLDVGCGPGVDTGSLALRGVNTVGLDIAAAMLELAAPHTGGHVVQADQRCLPFADGTFHGVWANASFQHVSKADMRDVATELGRVMRTGGVLSLIVPLGQVDGLAMRKDGVEACRWYSFFEPDELRAILRRCEIDVIDAAFSPRSEDAPEGSVALVARRR